MSNVEVFLSALGTFIVLVLGALGGWWIKISQHNHQQNMELEKLKIERDIETKKAEAALATKARRDTSKEWVELSDKQSDMLEERSQEIHDFRDRLNAAELKEKACQVRVAKLESTVDDLVIRLDESFQHIGDLEDALSKAGVNVIRRRQPKPTPGSKSHHSPLKDNGDNNG